MLSTGAPEHRSTVALLSAVCSLLYLPSAQAATITATSCSQQHVQAALNAAADGDTVNVPPGTCRWNVRVEGPPNRGIRLVGAGIGRTVIIREKSLPLEALLMHARAGKYTEITGFTCDSLFVNKDEQVGARCFTVHSGSVQGLNTFRVHHNAFTNINRRGLYLLADGIISSGLVDHNEFYCGGDGGEACQGVMGDNCEQNGLDPSTRVMNQPVGFGGPYANYFEDNEYFATRPQDGSVDNYSCGRMVQRFETLHGFNMGNHGTENRRGTQTWEHYHNHIDTSLYASGTDWSGRWIHIRNGTGFFFNNTATPSVTGPIAHYMYRMDPTWDKPMDFDYCVPGNPFQPGPHRRDGRLGGTSGYASRPVGWPCLDQIGWKFDQMGGDGGDFERAPAYLFGNRRGGVRVDSTVDTRNAPGYINEDFDYFNEKSPFNGTSGVGIGTRAQMNAITSCAEYTGFWVTDEGNWNTSNGATPDGRLYQCRSRAWVLAYTPYTYPHPLTLGPPPPPAPTACDVNRSGATTVHDIQLASNQVLRISACATGDINRDGNCTSVDVQRVVNAALGGLCITNP